MTETTSVASQPGVGQPGDELLDRLHGLDACAVSDALDTLGLPGAVTGLSPTWPDRRVTAGRVPTVKAGPKTGTGPQAHIATPLVAVCGPGGVAVPADAEDEVLRISLEIADKEASIVAKALAGATIAQARAEFGHHDLQRKR